MIPLDHHTSTPEAAQRWEQWHSDAVPDLPDPAEYADCEVRPVRTEVAA